MSSASSESADASLDDASGEKPEPVAEREIPIARRVVLARSLHGSVSFVGGDNECRHHGRSGDRRDFLAFPRHEQTFPTLTHHEIERMRRFGELRTYRHGEALFETGKPGPGMFVVLSGHVAITQRDGLGHVTPVIDQGPGQFLAEIGQLSGRVALVDGHAEGDVETLLIPPEQLRALLVAEADLGERIMRALILRRVSLIQGGVGGPVLIGPASLGDMARLQNFLARNGQPHHLLDPADRQGRRRSRRALCRPRAPICRWWCARTAPCCAIRRRRRLALRDRHDRRPRP